jgi:hypothetical protein
MKTGMRDSVKTLVTQKTQKSSRKRKAIIGIELFTQTRKNKQTKLKVIMDSLWDPFLRMRIKHRDMGKIKCSYSLFLFGKRHIIREICFRIENSKYFSVLLSINLVADILLSGLGTFEGNFIDLSYLRFLNTVFFALETSTKIIVHGCILTEGAYLRDIFNIINIGKILGYVIEIFSNGGTKKVLFFYFL